MSQPHPIQDVTARRTFYRQLTVALLVPAGVLMTLFMLPVLFANAAMTSGTDDSCSVQHRSGTALRVVSETYRQNVVTFYLRDGTDAAWQPVLEKTRPYQVARADCSQVVFLDELTLLYQDNLVALVNADGAVSRLEVAATCETIQDVRRTSDAETVRVICEANETYQLVLPSEAG